MSAVFQTSFELIPKVTVPTGRCGAYKVVRFSVSEAEAKFFNLREAISGRRRNISPGVYTALRYLDDTVVMSDTPAERKDHRTAVAQARGHCLVTGLGLGVVVNAMLRKPEVTKVTVIEISSDVIKLVAPHYERIYGARFEVINADAMIYKPPQKQRYGVVWHDIWEVVSGDNLSAMKKLHARYARRCEWQGSWCRELCADRL